MNDFNKFKALLIDIYHQIGISYLLYLLIMIIAGLFEGISLASIIPLLSAIGIGNSTLEISDTGFNNRLIGMITYLGAPKTEFYYLGFLILIVGISGLMFLLQTYVGSRLQTKYVYQWQSQLSKAIFSSNLIFFNKNRHGDLINTIVTETQRLGGAFYQAGILLTGITHGLIFLMIAAFLSPPITLSIISGGILLFLLTRPLIKRASLIGKNISITNADIQTMVGDFVSGVKLLKATASEKDALKQLNVPMLNLRESLFKNSFDIQIAKCIFDFGATIIILLIIITSHTLFAVNPAILLVVLAMFVRIMPKLAGIQQSLQSIALSLPAVTLVNELYENANQHREQPNHEEMPDPLKNGPLKISMKDVSVFHADTLALSKITMEIPSGSCIAIVGDSGSGKSTLVDSILGLVPINAGLIQINDFPLSSIPLHSLRKRVGYMAQETIIYHGTLGSNILWGHIVDLKGTLNAAAKLASIDTFINKLPKGYDTEISNRGSNFSGGERQRIGLARALLGSPGLLILDEATSALDVNTESAITNALLTIKGGVTIIIIAHRLSSARLADTIYVLDKGQIIESGTWDQLQQGDSRFNHLWRLQTSPNIGK